MNQYLEEKTYGKNLSGNNLSQREFSYRFNFSENLRHRNDSRLHEGYSFRGNVIWNSVSNTFYKEDKRKGILNAIEVAIVHLIDSVKDIKKTFNWVIDKDVVEFN